MQAGRGTHFQNKNLQKRLYFLALACGNVTLLRLVGIQVLKCLLLFGWNIISLYCKAFLWEKKHKISTQWGEMLNSQGCLYLRISDHAFLPPSLKNSHRKIQFEFEI